MKQIESEFKQVEDKMKRIEKLLGRCEKGQNKLLNDIRYVNGKINKDGRIQTSNSSKD